MDGNFRLLARKMPRATVRSVMWNIAGCPWKMGELQASPAAPEMIHWINRKLRRLTVSGASPAEVAGVSRVEWKIGGSPLWFESADARLSNAPDAMACLCFAASSLAGWRMRFPDRICPVLGPRLKRIGRIWSRWWQAATDRFETRLRGPAPSVEEGRGTAVFLSLGVDSFHTLLRTPETGTIVYVAGYDVRLDEKERLERITESLRDVATRHGVKLIFLRTNLREHPVLGTLSWDRFHGAALAAAGHLLATEISRILISSSFPKVFFKPWGTSWKTDFLWSSSKLEVVHFGEHLWRLEKLEQIVDEPLVRDHLRICWEHRNHNLNCGECEKCLRTMLGLASMGKLEFYPTFPDAGALARGLRDAPALTTHLLPTYKSFLARGLPSEVDIALRGLIGRSKTRIKSNNPKIS